MPKLKVSYLVLVLGVGAWAQQAAPSPKVPAAGPFAAKASPMKSAMLSAASRKPEPSVNQPTSGTDVKEPATAVDKSVSAAKPLPTGRDPFVSPVKAMEDEPEHCHGGKRCLSVGEIQLKGTVLSRDGHRLALIETAQHRSYTLAERDQLFDGVVVRIAGDSVTFDESHRDRAGKMQTKQVTKRVEAPPV